MQKVLKILVGLGFVGLFMWLVVNMWIIEARIDKLNFIIKDYSGEKKSGMNEEKLIDYLRGNGCVVDIVEEKQHMMYVRTQFLWIRKTWVIER